jgi:hypothetical protein
MDDHKNLTDRLRAQAELCLKLASQCWDEQRAERLRVLARECLDGIHPGDETPAVARVRRKPAAR